MDFSTTMVIYLSAYVITIIYFVVLGCCMLFLKENPHLSLCKVAEQSGFRSQPTFRKAFQEVMGCLPSEVKAPSRPPRGEEIVSDTC